MLPDELTTYNIGDQVIIMSRTGGQAHGPFIVTSAVPHGQGKTPIGGSAPSRIIRVLDPATDEEREVNSLRMLKLDDYAERGSLATGFPDDVV